MRKSSKLCLAIMVTIILQMYIKECMNFQLGESVDYDLPWEVPFKNCREPSCSMYIYLVGFEGDDASAYKMDIL